MCKIVNKEEMRINIYENTNLPEKGWIQGCIWCCAPTSRTEFYKKCETIDVNYILHIHLCKDCCNYKVLQVEKNRKSIDKFIEKEYLISCRSNPSHTSL